MNQPHRLLISLSITKVGVSRRKGGFRAERTKVTGAGSLEAGPKNGLRRRERNPAGPGALSEPYYGEFAPGPANQGFLPLRSYPFLGPADAIRLPLPLPAPPGTRPCACSLRPLVIKALSKTSTRLTSEDRHKIRDRRCLRSHFRESVWFRRWLSLRWQRT